MIILVKGTPDSGKSKLAEELTCQMAGQTKKYYIATMVPYGEEGKKRVEKHRKLREGKGFETLELPILRGRLSEVEDKSSTCLLECTSNLVGNEMFLEENSGLGDEELKALILESMYELGKKVTNLIIVTNEFEKENPEYDQSTRRYIHMTDLVNEELKEYADVVYEHVKGEWKKYDNN